MQLAISCRANPERFFELLGELENIRVTDGFGDVAWTHSGIVKEPLRCRHAFANHIAANGRVEMPSELMTQITSGHISDACQCIQVRSLGEVVVEPVSNEEQIVRNRPLWISGRQGSRD